MQFSQLPLNKLHELLNDETLKVSTLIKIEKNLSGYKKYILFDVLHHKDFIFPQTYLRNNQLCLEGNKAQNISDFQSKLAAIPSDSFTFLKDSPYNSLLKTNNFLNLNNNVSIIHDNLLSHNFIKKLQELWLDHIISTNNKEVTVVLNSTIEYPIKQFYKENLISDNQESIGADIKQIYHREFNSILHQVEEHGLSPIRFTNYFNPSFLEGQEILLSKAIRWLEKNITVENIQETISFFNQKNYIKNDFFEVFLKTPQNRAVLESLISSIDAVSDEQFKKSTYKKYPFLKFEMPNIIANVTEQQILLKLTHIFSMKNFIESNETSSQALWYGASKTTSQKDNVTQNMQKIANYATKFYGVQPFKIKKNYGDTISLEGSNSIDTNKKIAHYLNILFYEVFHVANPVNNNISATIEANLANIHNQVLESEIPEVQDTLKNSHSIKKF